MRLILAIQACDGWRRVCALLAALGVLLPLVAWAQDAGSGSNPSGLKLPRFSATRSEEVNVRYGPGTQYDISFVFVRAGMPVEVTQEFDTWRKIRDHEGAEGWVHQNLLTGGRFGVVVPAEQADRAALRDIPTLEGTVRAWLENGLIVAMESCDGAWCAVSAQDNSNGNTGPTYRGHVRQIDLWGIYRGERFD